MQVAIPYPNPDKDLKVGLALVKWFLAIPHYFVLAGLASGRGRRDRHRVVCHPLHGPLP